MVRLITVQGDFEDFEAQVDSVIFDLEEEGTFIENIKFSTTTVLDAPVDFKNPDYTPMDSVVYSALIITKFQKP